MRQVPVGACPSHGEMDRIRGARKRKIPGGPGGWPPGMAFAAASRSWSVRLLAAAVRLAFNHEIVRVVHEAVDQRLRL